MTRRAKLLGAVLGLVAMACMIAAWPIYKLYAIKPASPALIERTKKAVEQHPDLKKDYDEAMKDGVLTYPEAKAILEKAGEKVEPEN
jgi:hypothetical protein